MKKIAIAAVTVGIVVAGSYAVRADVKDPWITTQTTIVLLTADGFQVKGATTDTTDGKVTMRGTVTTEADRAKAEQSVLKVDGVKAVSNLLEIVPANKQDMAAAITDSDVKKHVEASLKADTRMKDVTVTSVTDGVVLLSGKADNLGENLRAIQNAYGVQGVYRVSSNISTTGN